jgi:general secretion pathway protein K
LPTFFAAAKKVGAAPHRGNACIPTRKQEKAKTEKGQKKAKNQKS